jgi:CheY-like chemotaxis protein
MVAEDFDDFRHAMKAVLEAKGCHVVEAADGAQAVWMALEAHPKLILMDLEMPVIDGFEATRQIRQRAEMSDVPIVALTARSDESWRRRALDSGCSDYVIKPFDLDLIDKLLKRYLDI